MHHREGIWGGGAKLHLPFCTTRPQINTPLFPQLKKGCPGNLNMDGLLHSGNG